MEVLSLLGGGWVLATVYIWWVQVVRAADQEDLMISVTILLVVQKIWSELNYPIGRERGNPTRGLVSDECGGTTNSSRGIFQRRPRCSFICHLVVLWQ